MDRLFVFGDSWAFNYFTKKKNPFRPELLPNCGKSDIKTFVQSFQYYGHWTDYISNYYDVFNYAETGCSIENVIYQFGYLPEFKKGDRIVCIFPTNERFNWIYNNEKSSLNINSPWLLHMPDIISNQLYDRKEAWSNLKIRNDEKRFINKIPQLLKCYEPILITWDNDTFAEVDNLKLFNNDNTIYSESNGKYFDYHLGVNGNYELFKFIGNELNIDVEIIDFKNQLIKQII